jgi:hypothetical protein
VRALRVGFVLDGEVEWETDGQPWIEVRVTNENVVVEAVPGDPIVLTGGANDGKALAVAFMKARESRGIVNRLDVDVLVGPDVDVQRLVDTLVALDVAGARIFGVGRIPAAGTDEASKRGKRIAVAQLERTEHVGDLTRDQIVTVLNGANPSVKACYEQALAAKPTTEGKLSTRIVIGPDGKVLNATAGGLDGGLAACVQVVLSGLTFPKPTRGGQVDARAAFLMRH